MKATVEQLAEIGIFATLNRTELERLQSNTEIRAYRQGEVVMYEGDSHPRKIIHYFLNTQKYSQNTNTFRWHSDLHPIAHSVPLQVISV